MLMGIYSKLYLQFESPFWENDQELLLTISDDLYAETNVFPWAINLNHQKWLPGSNTLSFHVIDDVARAIESQPIENTIEDALHLLRMKYGNDAVTTSRVLDAFVTNWTHNPYSYGSYSDWPIGYTAKQHNAMIAPFGMDGKRKNVYFAGEHTTYDASSNQAIQSGELTAGRLAKRIVRMKQNQAVIKDDDADDGNNNDVITDNEGKSSDDNTNAEDSPLPLNTKCVDNPDY